MATSLAASKISLVAAEKVNQIRRVRVQEMRPIAQNQWIMKVKAESDLPYFHAGQFAMLSLAEGGDPILPRPFAIVAVDQGAYEFIYRVVGKFSQTLTRFSVGQSLDLFGPLGCGFDDDFLRTKKIVAVAGGVGFASVLPALERVKEKSGPAPLIYYGVRSDLETIRRWPYAVKMASDDGSVGFKGRLHDLLTKDKNAWEKADAFLVCGPSAMMRAVYSVLPPERSYYFVEEAMGCGFGVCMGCVITVTDAEGRPKRVRSCLEGSVMGGDRLKVWATGMPS